jgi:two-component system, OmpR family, sensor histidine kinase SenX3
VRRRKTIIFFLVFGICLILLAVALNVGWILVHLREAAILVLGIVFFAVIITGIVLNTIFLIREIRRNEKHDAFLNAVTHELKTPVASIKLYLETLRSREVAPERRAEFYDVMLADTNRLLASVEQVLEASRVREKKKRTAFKELDLAGVIRESIDIVRAQRHLQQPEIKFTVPAGGLNVVGDPADLQTAFINLLDNAVKYSPGQPRVAVRAKHTRLSGAVDVLIRDSGSGIPPAELKRIFRRFYRVDGTGPKGTGLGLFIVRSIIERHGGKVRAQSRGPGTGSTFLVRLPAA